MKIVSTGFILMIICWPTRSWADLDQLCLKQCVAGGASSYSCMKQCTYAKPDLTPILNGQAAATPPLSSHDVLAVPLPAGDAIVLPHKAAPSAPDKDYACVATCLHSRSTYGYCEQRCALPQCPAGSVTCFTQAKSNSETNYPAAKILSDH